MNETLEGKNKLKGAIESPEAVQLRLLMKQREHAAKRLMTLDFEIWALEEFFRTDPRF